MVHWCYISSSSSAFTLSDPVKLSQTPNSSKINHFYEQSNPTRNHLDRYVQMSTHIRNNKIVESFSFAGTPVLNSSPSPTPAKQCHFPFPNTSLCQNQAHFSHLPPLHATLNSPKGFGRFSKKSKRTKKSKIGGSDEDDDDDNDDDEDEEPEGVIPEIVTNRMISRMGFTVGIPLFIGLLFFPFFYYLKVGLKIDVPTWVPFIVSFIFFGTALLGVSYGIVSSSWDPLREGSVLGWNEARKNWPVFWQSLWGRSGKK